MYEAIAMKNSILNFFYPMIMYAIIKFNISMSNLKK
jgi:hypothetical protein